MGAFFFVGTQQGGKQNMFKINRYHYVDKKSKVKFEIFSRTTEFADELANRITKIGIYSLQRVKFGFCKPVLTEYPPYELEQAQAEYVEGLEIKQ